jgi:hypothetical protein
VIAATFFFGEEGKYAIFFFIFFFSCNPFTMINFYKWQFITGENLYIIFHQVMFLLTGLSTTLGTQWIFYHGAASKEKEMK